MKKKNQKMIIKQDYCNNSDENHYNENEDYNVTWLCDYNKK